MRKIKLFSFDLDGTLLNDESKVNHSTIKSFELAKEKDIILVANSGRSYFQMEELLEQCGEYFDYLICNNGSYIFHAKEKKIEPLTSLSNNLIKEVVNTVKHLKPYVALNTLTGTYIARLFEPHDLPEWHTEDIGKDWNSQTDTFHSFDEILNKIEEETIMQVAFSTNVELSKYIKNELLEPFADKINTFISWPTNVDVNPLNSNKLVGLKKLSEMLNIGLSDIAAFGDSGNDIEMVRDCGIGFAMGNATPELKKVADEIIDDNNSDAISRKINELIGLNA